MSDHIVDPKALLERVLANGNIPRHVAIIMDGNGRWAKGRGLQRIFGHRAAVESVRESVRAAACAGVEVLSLFTFSIENWGRPPAEVSALMRLLVETIPREVPELDKNGVRLHIVGRTEDLSAGVFRTLQKAQADLAKNDTLDLILALSYGGKAEIADAARAIAEKVKRGELQPDEVDEAVFERHLYTAAFPHPDLLIRTSGERRISNFYLWQLAYAELSFTRTLWPDFRSEHFYRAILDYQERDRRFGHVDPVPEKA